MPEPTQPAGDGGKRPLSDHSLLLQARGGNQEAAAALYLRYAPRLRDLARARFSADLARRLDAEDIVQSVFSTFFQGVHQGQYEVPAGRELWQLLLVIALNKIRAHGKFHRAARRDVRLTAGGERLDEGARYERDHAPLALLQLAVDEILQRLPAAHRQVVLSRIEGFEVAEIAERVGCSRRTAERVLQEFRRRLAKALELEN
jgi:RNA polymerase sigma-70 factor (ECF subfamily)